MRRQPLAHLRRHPALQRVFVFEAELLDARLRDGTHFPLIFYRFIAAGVNPVAGKDRQHFGEHVLHEVDHRV